MPFFQYTARTVEGSTVSGTTEALNASIAARILREQGLTPTLINEGGSSAAASGKLKGKSGRVRLDDLVVFSRQFSTMIRAGLPLIEVLNILAEQSEKVALRKVLQSIEHDVGGGASLAEALGKHPAVFDTFFVSMVKAGEASGTLDSILDQVAIYLEKAVSIQRKVKSAVMYPTAVSGVALIITVFLLAFVVPTFKSIFSDLGGDLPFVTKIIIALSNLILHRFYIIIGVIIVAVFFFRQWYKTQSGKMAIDRLKLKLPVFGPLFLKVAISRFTRTLGTLIRSGVNILSALDIVSTTSGNLVIEEALIKTKASIQSGETFSKPLVECGVFPPMVTRMIDVGERTGALEGMLTKIADFYEDQVDAMVAGLASLIEPMLIVFLGVVVGFIVIAMYLPMFDMIKTIK